MCSKPCLVFSATQIFFSIIFIKFLLVFPNFIKNIKKNCLKFRWNLLKIPSCFLRSFLRFFKTPWNLLLIFPTFFHNFFRIFINFSKILLKCIPKWFYVSWGFFLNFPKISVKVFVSSNLLEIFYYSAWKFFNYSKFFQLSWISFNFFKISTHFSLSIFISPLEFH